jgi:SNF2 family DNA or RNA helicase
MKQEFKYKTKPFEHQREALKKGATSLNFAYFMEMGTGKTKVAIDNASYLFCENLIDTVVVIAPNSVYRNWEKEIDTHCSVEHNITLHKVNKKFNYELDKLNFFLINVEALSHTSGVSTLSKIIGPLGQKTMMIIDESTTIKNKSAKRTKNISKLGKYVKYKRILTGSPITKSPLDLFSQCAFLDTALLGFDSFYTFQARYAVMKQINMGGRSVLLPQYFTNLDELEQKLKTFSFRVKKEDCLDLPEKLYQKRLIQLPEEQRKVYDQLKKNAYSILQDKEVSFANKLTEILRLHQVTNGFVKTDEEEITTFDKCPKLKELFNLLDEAEGKFIIWANYVQNIETIIKKLGEVYGKESVVSIYGAVTTEHRQEAVKRFQNDPQCRFLVGNPSTGGYGLTLTSASYVVYFSNSYNLEVRQQSEDRAHRIGQTRNVVYIDILAEKTIDEMIVSALKRKVKISSETLGEQIKNWI